MSFVVLADDLFPPIRCECRGSVVNLHSKYNQLPEYEYGPHATPLRRFILGCDFHQLDEMGISLTSTVVLLQFSGSTNSIVGS